MMKSMEKPNQPFSPQYDRISTAGVTLNGKDPGGEHESAIKSLEDNIRNTGPEDVIRAIEILGSYAGRLVSSSDSDPAKPGVKLPLQVMAVEIIGEACSDSSNPEIKKAGLDEFSRVLSLLTPSNADVCDSAMNGIGKIFRSVAKEDTDVTERAKSVLGKTFDADFSALKIGSPAYLRAVPRQKQAMELFGYARDTEQVEKFSDLNTKEQAEEARR